MVRADTFFFVGLGLTFVVVFLAGMLVHPTCGGATVIQPGAVQQ